MFADHVEFLCHLVALESIEAVIQWFSIACDTAPDAGSMGGEECADSRAMLAEVEDGESRLPLVAMHDSGRHIKVLVQALCYLTDSIGKEATLVVIAIGGMALDTKSLPHVAEDLVFLCPEFIPFE